MRLSHGKASTYTNHRCRCDRCRAAWVQCMLAYKRAKRVRGECWDCTSKTDGYFKCKRHRESEALRRRNYRKRQAAS